LYQLMQYRFSDLKIIASGGVANLEDLKAIEKMGLNGAIFGKAFYEGRITLEDLKNYGKR
jgi:phosphoribosylformimino-5-aminoimidazole carboxamide ribotide isomerase